jgi:2,4-dienoyl-CoA reductase-like NADH-dependent reductase (Old Yellow Enzyme family)
MNIDLGNTKIHHPDDPPSTSYTVGGIHIPTRFFLAPINTGFFADGLPTEGLRQFHVERSGRSIGISYVGNVAIHSDYVNSPTTAYISSHHSWRRLAEAISLNGSVPGIQLACKTLREPSSKKWVTRDLKAFVECSRAHLASLSENYLDAVMDRFVCATQVAASLGFLAVQLHAAHGYFLSLLLSKEVNRRADKYRDGVEILCNLIKTIRSLDLTLMIDVRLSLTEGIRCPELEIEELQVVVPRIAAAGADMISLSNGYYDVNKFQIYPRIKDGLGCYVDIASTLATTFNNKLWNVAGNIWDINALAQRLPPNLTLSIGRALIADPTFIDRNMRSSVKEIRTCIRSGYCHYYSRGKHHIECKVNPTVAGDSSYLLPML